uniref:Hydroxysteroid (20-beta) dehydrogenase 2 n=1 Tax=Paramormyrops kingsleyae TaxID=1676925 RepID=A0A3B3RLT3_9TELE
METLLESALVLRALVVIGGFTVLFYCCKFTWKCWRGFRVYVLSEYWRADLRAYGQWAVVTGATSGIGKAYAMELASRGLDVVLVSRSEGKLQAVAKEIESMYGRQTRIIQTDFTEGPQIYPRIAEKLQGLEIGILVNNVGMNYAGMLVSFLDVPDPEQRITQVINCNILSVTQVSVPGCKGLIINVSSEAASAPQPLLTLYSATKRSVSVLRRLCFVTPTQCVTPFIVSTNMTYNIEVGAFVKSASAYAHEALNTVGYSSFTSGCVLHALQHFAFSILFPEWIRLSSFSVRQMERFARSHQQQIEAMIQESQKKQS